MAKSLSGEREDSLHDDQPELNRRRFLRMAGRRSLATACSWLVPIGEGDESSTRQDFNQASTDRQQTVAYQSILAEYVAELPWIDGELPWYSRSISDECNACLACGQRCPTGALHVEESETGRSIHFKTALCTDCGLCAQVCPVDAITRHSINDVAEVVAPRVSLMNRPHATCRQCGDAFVVQKVDEELCYSCINEQELKNGWLSMV
jgi:ferredoxin